ncbi:hypothetical protein FPQ18DRAFT_390428 [Pyronema domesticum]|uniref:Uncharacterized protein n=1 Tax=Pyronema omphalodes (strain CBS 100304) TaxID=1076935 RepID=U4L6I8_PYROM|nr:hypothetical protein FPQ18DRAFT_390428 [Pyronema domesticum]CCX08177.1 Protein of unknown function [Pyronema omphalodes CBS 100304]
MTKTLSLGFFFLIQQWTNVWRRLWAIENNQKKLCSFQQSWQAAETESVEAIFPRPLAHHINIQDAPELPGSTNNNSGAVTTTELNRLSIGSIANGDGSLELDGISATRGYFDMHESAPYSFPTWTMMPKGRAVGNFITSRGPNQHDTCPFFGFENLFLSSRPSSSSSRGTVLTTIKEEEEPSVSKPDL